MGRGRRLKATIRNNRAAEHTAAAASSLSLPLRGAVNARRSPPYRLNVDMREKKYWWAPPPLVKYILLFALLPTRVVCQSEDYYCGLGRFRFLHQVFNRHPLTNIFFYVKFIRELN